MKKKILLNKIFDLAKVDFSNGFCDVNPPSPPIPRGEENVALKVQGLLFFNISLANFDTIHLHTTDSCCCLFCLGDEYARNPLFTHSPL